MEIGDHGVEGGEQGERQNCMETYCNGNFLKYMKVILMRSQNNKEDGVPNDCLLPPHEASSARTGLHLINLLVKNVPWKPKVVTKLIYVSQQMNSLHC